MKTAMRTAPARNEVARVFNQGSDGRSGLVELEAVLAQVVGEVARVDPEQAGRVLAHAARPALGLEQQLASRAG